MIFKDKGLLGINARNLHYIRPYNKKKAVKLADDKIKTKQFLSTREIPVPKLYNIVKDNSDLEKLDLNTISTPFVLKPNKGFGGEGIIPILEKRDDFFITASGKQLSEQDIIEHIQDILDGRYSISNVGDYAFMEQFIVADEKLGKYSYEGLPDIRVVVHNLIPVMAMLRLPTKESEGKANLHMGAVGVGIDIAKGTTTYISYKNKIIDELPNGIGKIRGVEIPYWDDILLIASKVQLLTNLGYMAIDLCIDKNSGPVLLEINARAGLGVQIANLAPLRKRLERIEGVKVMSPVKGVRIAKDMFGNTVEKEIEHLSGKQVIGTKEAVELIKKNGTIRINAKIDTSNNVSVLDAKFAREMGLVNKEKEEKNTQKIKFSLKNNRIQTVVELKDLENQEHKMILGNRDLKQFLIDTSHNSKVDLPDEQGNKTEEITVREVKPKINYSRVDQSLIGIDNQIKLLFHLKPTNLEEEKEKFFKSNTYNPQFEYPEIKFNPVDLIDKLSKIQIDDSETGEIFSDKKREIENKIKLLDSIGEPEFTRYSKDLYGTPSESEYQYAKKQIESLSLKQGEQKKSEQASLSAEEVKERFEKVFLSYGLKSWKVKLKESMVADCLAGKSSSLFIRSDARFSKERVESLIVHEIETHIITAENGKMQEYEIFNRGLANYLITQEGLAMYNVEQQRNSDFRENYKALAHVIAIYLAQTKSFREIFNELQNLGVPKNSAFKSALKCKRGLYDSSQAGAFTKDFVYFKGYLQIKSFVENGGELKDLYIGKLNLTDLEKVKKIPSLRQPKILPKWLEN